jgi:hypothetical protein
MIKLLLKIPYFRKQLIKIAFDSTYLAKEGEDAAKLKYVLTDSKGVRYYEYVRTEWLPVQRVEQMDIRLKEHQARIGRESLELFADTLETVALSNDPKKFITISQLAGELRKRLQILYSPDIMMRTLCGMLIREDQIGSAHIWNQVNENEKFNQLMGDNKFGGLSFFFQLRLMKDIFKLTNTSDTDWEQATSEEILQTQLKEVTMFDQLMRDISNFLKPKS